MKTFKRILSLVLTFAMVFSIAAMGVVADDTPDVIDSAEEFKSAVETGGTVTLPKNSTIDFENVADDFYPIKVAAGTVIEGNGTTLTNVNVGSKGLFNLSECSSDANKLTVNDLNIGTSETPAIASSTALICETNSSYSAFYTEWNDVSIWATLTVSSGKNTGVFFGQVGGVHNFTDCNVTVTQDDVQANAFGVYIGRSQGTHTFDGCTASGAIINGKNVGGFVGKLDYGNKGTFVNCVNNATLTSTGSGNTAGGFVGNSNANDGVPTFSGCVNNGLVTATDPNKVATGHFHGNLSVQDSITGLKSVPSGVEQDEFNGETYLTIHNLSDLQTKLTTAGNYILAQHIDVSGLSAAVVVADGVVLEGYGMSLLGLNLTNAASGLFDLLENYDYTNADSYEGVIFRNFTVGRENDPAKSINAVMVSYPTASKDNVSGMDKELLIPSKWKNVTVYAQLAPNSHAGVFGRYPGGDWIFENVDVYVDFKNASNNGAGGFFGRFSGNASFTGCSVNNLTSTGLIQNGTNNAGGYMGKCETGYTLTFDSSVNNANVTCGGGSSGNGVGGFVGVNGGSTLSFTACVNAGNITASSKAMTGAMVGVVSSGKETVNSFINVGTLSGVNYTTETEKMVYNGITYTIDSATKQVEIDGTSYTVLATANCFKKLNSENGKFVLFNDINMGTVTNPYPVANGVELDGNNHSLTNLTLDGEAFLFTFTAGNAATFKNLTIGSESAPVTAWAAVISYAYAAEDVDPEWDANYEAKLEEAQELNASIGAFDTTWKNVDIYATFNSAANAGAFFGGNLDGTHTFTDCTATVSLADGTTTQGNQVGAFIGRNKSGDVTFDGCTANGTIVATTTAGGFIGKMDATAKFKTCFVNTDSISATTNAAGFVGTVESSGDASFTDCEVNGSIVATTTAGGYIALCNNTAAFDGCVNNAVVTSKAAAGFVGTIGTSSAITFVDCDNTAAVTSNANNAAAGFVATSTVETASSTNGYTNTIFIADSRNSGAISGQYAGGFISNASATITIRGCVNAATVTSTNQSAGFVVGDSYLTVTISDSINRGTISSTGSWAAGFIRRVGHAMLTDCVNIGDISVKGNGGAAVQLIATMQNTSNGPTHTVTITNCYALAETVTGTTTGNFIHPDYEKDSRVTLADNETEENERYNNRFYSDGTLRVIKASQETKAAPKDYAATNVYDVRFLAGVDSGNYDAITMVVNITMGDWTNTVTLDIKTIYESVLAATGDNSGSMEEVVATSEGANYFAAGVITDVPTGIANIDFEVTLFVTENGVTYQMGNTVTFTYDTTGTFVTSAVN